MHKLRKTHLSMLASHGYSVKSLMERAGHSKIDTTLKYYISADEDTRAKETELLNMLFEDTNPIVSTSRRQGAVTLEEMKQQEANFNEAIEDAKKTVFRDEDGNITDSSEYEEYLKEKKKKRGLL